MEGSEAFAVEVLSRLPLAQSVLSIFGYVLNEPFLDQLFEEHRSRGYEGVLTFAEMVYLVRDALLIHKGFGLPTFQRAAADGNLPVHIRSTYPKLARMELAVSKALLRESSLKMRDLLAEKKSPLPTSLEGLMVIAFDGKTIKSVRHQLKALRSSRGKLCGGKLMVGVDLHSGIALAMNACEDSDRNDTPLVPGLVEQIRGMIPLLSKLWIGDRQFSDLNLFCLMTENTDHFLIRMNRTLGFTRDAENPVKTGVDDKGRAYTDECGWVGKEKDKRRRYVRKITLLATKTQDEIILLTDLLDDNIYPAVDLLAAYLQRWGIEQVFQKITEVFSLEQLIGCTPRANIFQASFCLVIYNAIEVMRSYVARAGKVTVEEVSTAKLFDDVKEELIAQSKLGTPEAVVAAMEEIKTPKQMKHLLKTLLEKQWEDRWKKSPTIPRKTVDVKKRFVSGECSVFKILQKYRATRLKSAA